MEGNRDTILQLISLIKQRPAIWDYHSPEHKIKRKRREAIEEVALLMGVTPKEVSTKWIILRNQYSRERRKMTESSGSSPYTVKWYAYKAMDALMGQNKRPIRDDFWTQESKSDDEDDSSRSPPQRSRPATSGVQSQAVGSLVENSMTVFNETIKALRSIKESKNDYGSTKDELTNYGLYIAAHLRKFSPPLQSRAKYEINKILYALDLESMGEYSASIQSVEDNDDITIAKECKFDPLSQKE